MAVTKYLTVDGKIQGEHSASTGYLAYMTDALGSVAKTVDTSGTVQKSMQYKPWGEVWRATGPGSVPNFNWAGAYGYYDTSLQYRMVSRYVRARHVSGVRGSWISVDPLWPGQPAYRYVDGRVTRAVDPSGMKIKNINCPDSKFIENMCLVGASCLRNSVCRDNIFQCVGGVPRAFFDKLADVLANLCGDPPKDDRNVCVFCHNRLNGGDKKKCGCGGLNGLTIAGFKQTNLFTKTNGVLNPIRDAKTGNDLVCVTGVVPLEVDCDLALLGYHTENNKWVENYKGSHPCEGVVLMCQSSPEPGVLMHELMHVLGNGKNPGHGDKRKGEFIDRLDGCIRKFAFGEDVK